MDTLHKKLSEIRDLRSEELDLVGGAEEGSTNTVWQSRHLTNSMVTDVHTGVQYYQADDGYVDVFYDNNQPYP
jgi:hypothetical protein